MVGKRLIRSVAAAVLLTGAITVAVPGGAAAAYPASYFKFTTKPYAGSSKTHYIVAGIVAHVAPRAGTFALVGHNGSFAAIGLNEVGHAPPLGHSVKLVLRQVGDTMQLVKVLAVSRRYFPDLPLRGVVSYVSPRGKRFTLSGRLGASILIRHRLRGRLPALASDAIVVVHINSHGKLVERRLINGHRHKGLYEVQGGLLNVVLPTTDPVFTPSEELVGGCPSGCLVVSPDDAGSVSGDSILVGLDTSNGQPPLSYYEQLLQVVHSGGGGAADQASAASAGGTPVVQLTLGPPVTISQPTPPTPPTPAPSVPYCVWNVGGVEMPVSSDGAPCPTTQVQINPNLNTPANDKIFTPPLGNGCTTGVSLLTKIGNYLAGGYGCLGRLAAGEKYDHFSGQWYTPSPSGEVGGTGGSGSGSSGSEPTPIDEGPAEFEPTFFEEPPPIIGL